MVAVFGSFTGRLATGLSQLQSVVLGASSAPLGLLDEAAAFGVPATQQLLVARRRPAPEYLEEEIPGQYFLLTEEDVAPLSLVSPQLRPWLAWLGQDDEAVTSLLGFEDEPFQLPAVQVVTRYPPAFLQEEESAGLTRFGLDEERTADPAQQGFGWRNTTTFLTDEEIKWPPIVGEDEAGPSPSVFPFAYRLPLFWGADEELRPAGLLDDDSPLLRQGRAPERWGRLPLVEDESLVGGAAFGRDDEQPAYPARQPAVWVAYVALDGESFFPSIPISVLLLSLRGDGSRELDVTGEQGPDGLRGDGSNLQNLTGEAANNAVPRGVSGGTISIIGGTSG